ncbi:hypothetical protein [Ferruginibacter sp. SUN106]|uniref:hypothetical protein n=1 Tax=Ferruginibacter sp. SUN106 TaxID=2978348 RepID=UPI003D365C43
MRIAIILMLCFFSNQNVAQRIIAPTQFDTFINRPSVEWAAYMWGKVKGEKINFNKLLLNRYSKNEITGTFALYREFVSEYTLDFIKKDSLDKKALYPFCIMRPYDPYGEYPGPMIKPYPVDSSDKTTSLTEQIVYVENGRLKSYIPWITPQMLEFYTPINLMDYFSTCFNFKPDFKPGSQNKIIFLSQTTKKIRLDSTDAEQKLKELYGRNLLQTLWPYVLNGKLPVFSIKTNQQIAAAKVDTFIVSKFARHRFIYDTAGIKTGEEYYNEAPVPFYIKEVELVQNWYYDYKENIVLCKIPELIIYSDHWIDGHVSNESLPILKIVFN